MQRVLKYRISLVMMAVLTIFLLYPLLHELGHALAAWIFGGKVVRITIFPAFYTECIIRPEQLVCYIMTAMAGILLPLICSVAINIRDERGFLVVYCLRIMSFGYSVGELVCVSRLIMGSTAETSDLCVLVYDTGVDPYISLVLAGFFLILTLILLAVMTPVEHFTQLLTGYRKQYSASR